MASRSVVHFTATAGLTLILGGAILSCGGGHQAVPLPAPESRVSVAPHDEEMVTLSSPARPSTPPPATTEAPAPSPTSEVASNGAADRPSPRPRAAASNRVRVDAMVGQINGRPLFASHFFAPMDARLRAEAARMSPEDWLAFARGEIRKALVDRVRNELLLAEVESSLTPEQRAGLVSFVRTLREDLVSEARGSEALASKRFLEEEGITLEEAVQAQRDDELIRSWLRRILQNKVHVPWRDIRFRYERDFERFNPPPRARLRMIRVSATDHESIKAVTAGLSRGEEMESLAREYSSYIPEEGGLFETSIDAASYAESTLVGLAPLNDAAQRLAPGEIAGPIEVGSSVYWLKLEEIVDVKRSLYEVQERIRLELFSERAMEAEQEYFRELLDRSGLSDNEVERIGGRLLEIASERYLMSRQN